MKTTSIFPVHKLASLILMSKYAQSQQFFRGFPDNILPKMHSLKFDFEMRRRISILKHGYTCNKIRLANWFIL